MSKHIEVPLRPHTQPWPGMGTRVGFLDPGNGFLEDGSINVMINKGDVLQKRRGFVRGLDEWFDGVVCGLFKYTDKCGVEHLLVADESAINIRQPFAVPVFEYSDAYPFDAFAEDGPPSSYHWRNIGRYTASNSELGMRAGVADVSDPIAVTDVMYWFKDASSQSYQVQIEYAFDPDVNTLQQVAVLIKGVGDLSSGSYIMGQIRFGTGYHALNIYHFNGTTLTDLGTIGLTGDTDVNPRGFLTVSYERDVTIPRYRVRGVAIPRGGNQAQVYSDLNAAQDLSLGQTSGIAIGHSGGAQPDPTILVVDGGPI